MSLIKTIELDLSSGRTVTLNENAINGYLDNIDKDGNFKKDALVFNNANNETEEVIYTSHITFVKINYK